MIYKGFTIRVPTSGGKAGKGQNLTSTVQVSQRGQLLKQFRFFVNDVADYHDAMDKARRFVDGK